MIPRNRDGFAILGIVITILILAALGTGLAQWAASNQKSRTEQWQMAQATYANHGALEYALKLSLGGDTGTSYTRHLANTTMTITRANNLIKANVLGQDGTSANYQITDPNPPEEDGGQAACLKIDTSTGHLSTDFYKIQDIGVRRDPSCSPSKHPTITIVSMSISWQPNFGEVLNRIQFDGLPIEYSGPSRPSGSLFDFGANDFTFSDSGNHTLDNIRWESQMKNHDFFLTFNMVDGTSKIVEFALLADNQASCFSWGTSNAYMERFYEGNLNSALTRIVGHTIQNSCSKPIRVDKVAYAWSPLSPTRALVDIAFDGEQKFSGSAASGALLDIDDVILANDTDTANLLRFDNEILGRVLTQADWTFTDGTIKSYTLNLYAPNQGDCLNINTTNAAIGTGGSWESRRIIGMTVQNTCSADIGVTGLTTSWSGLPTQKVRFIAIGTTNYNGDASGNLSSGQRADFGIADVYLRDLTTMPFYYIQFLNPPLSGQSYTLLFDLVDGTTKSAVVTLP